MIRLGDALTLAVTKLRAYRWRTMTTVLLVGALFGIVIALACVSKGIFMSVDAFRGQGLTSRYIVGITPSFDARAGREKGELIRDPAIIDKAKQRYQQLIKDREADAKKLGIAYSPALEPLPYMQRDKTAPPILDALDSNGIARELLREHYQGRPVIDDRSLAEVAKRYGAIDRFDMTYTTLPRSSTLVALPGGKEQFVEQKSGQQMDSPTMPILGYGFTFAPQQITKPFMLPGAAGWRAGDGTIPIIVPQNVIEQLTKLDKVDNKSSAKEKIARLKLVRERAMNTVISACYRNARSGELIQEAIKQQRPRQKDEPAPTMTYELPADDSCGEARLTSDTRTVEQKQRDVAQQTFDQKHYQKAPPASYMVRFKVVGVSPVEVSEIDGKQNQERSIDSALETLLRTSSVGRVIPNELYQTIPEAQRHSELFTYTPGYLMGNEDNITRYVEFASANDARRFIDEQGCTTQVTGVCMPEGRPYQARLAFSNSSAVDDIKRLAQTIFWYIMAGIVVLTVVVMWVVLGRMIADGRHETAIFRAIGFQRSDITMIYIAYVGMMTVGSMIIACLVGWLGVMLVEQLYADQLTARALASFGPTDLGMRVSVMQIDWQVVPLILAVCVAVSVVATVGPLVRNVRRNPMRDMRSE